MSIVIKKPAGKPVAAARVAAPKPKAFYTVAELAERWGSRSGTFGV